MNKIFENAKDFESRNAQKIFTQSKETFRCTDAGNFVAETYLCSSMFWADALLENHKYLKSG